jgi:hypothetical protein
LYKISLNQEGLMKRGVLLIVLVLIVIAGVGWYVIDKNNQKDSAAANSSTSASTKNNSDYLVIKEWGVRFKLPDNLKNDVYYYYDSSSDQVKFGSKKYAAIEPLCSADKSSIGDSLQRKPLNFKQDTNSENTLVKTIGEYKYFIASSSVGCNQNNKLSEQQSADVGTEGSAVTDSIQKSLVQI